MSARTLAGASGPDAPASGLPWLEVAVEELVGNRLGSSVYRRWVAGLGLAGTECVLEVGTGAGACARHLARALPEGRLTCLDIDPRWLACARRRLAEYDARVEFVVADASAWSRPGAFDAAIAHFVLHDIASGERALVLARIGESLRPGGRLFVREPLGHGMLAEELHGQLEAAGFQRACTEERERVPLMGETLSGVWLRKEGPGQTRSSATCPPLTP